MVERSKEQLQALLEQSAGYGKQILEEKIALEKEVDELREKHLKKEEDLTQQVFELKRKFDVASNTIASLQEDASERSVLQKNQEAKESEQIRAESEVVKKALEDKIRNIEFEIDERDRKIKSCETENLSKDRLLSEIRFENESLKSGFNEKRAEDEVSAEKIHILKDEMFELKQQAMEREAREASVEAEFRKMEYLKTEAEIENEDLRRKVVGCENDVAKLKEDILCLEQLLENERLNQQKASDSKGNSLFGELDDQRRRAEEAFQLLKNRYELTEEKHAKAKETIKKLNADIQALLLVSCSAQVDEKEYASIGRDVKRLKEEVEEKEKEVEELKLVVKNKNSAIERLEAVGVGGVSASEEKTGSNKPAKVSDDAFVKYYKNCLERQKEETGEMEKRWKDEIMEKILVRDENTKLKFENAMIKRESQRQKTENYKLTMKITEMKDATAAPKADGAVSADPPPQKKQKIIVEKMPEDWKMKGFSDSPKADAEAIDSRRTPSPSLGTTVTPDSSVLAPLPTESQSGCDSGTPSSPLEKIASEAIISTTPERKAVKQKTKHRVLNEDEGVMKPEECNQQ